MARKKVAIVDYGMGNLRSVVNAVHELGAEGVLTDRPEAIHDFGHLILPGVGAFKKAMANLNEMGMTSALHRYISDGKPLLGVCLGMQLLCTDSQEYGHCEGLGVIQAHALPFPKGNGLRIPHMGWNAVHFQKNDPIFDGLESGCDTYFVHSYYVHSDAQDNILGVTDYEVNFCSVIGANRVYGMQFHPEKSQATGLQMLANFLAMD